MKLVYLLIILVIAISAITAHNYTTTQDMEKRLAALETARKQDEPETAWVLNAIETMYTLAFFNHDAWIKNNTPLYLSPSGELAYKKTLEDLDLIREITSNQSVLYAKVKNAPTRKRCWGVEIAKKAEPSSFCEYTIIMNLSTQSGAKMKFFGDHEFQVTVGSRYTAKQAEYTLNPKKEFLITDITVQAPKAAD